MKHLHDPSQNVTKIKASGKCLTQLAIRDGSILDFSKQTTKQWAAATGANSLYPLLVTPDIVVARDR